MWLQCRKVQEESDDVMGGGVQPKNFLSKERRVRETRNFMSLHALVAKCWSVYSNHTSACGRCPSVTTAVAH